MRVSTSPGVRYATILPDGTIALLASIVAGGKPGPFKIYHLAFAKPSPYLAALQKAVGRARRWTYPPPVPDIFPIAEPKTEIVAAAGRGRGSGADAAEQTRPVPPRAGPIVCRFSDAGMTDLSTRSGGRRPKSAKARNRGR